MNFPKTSLQQGMAGLNVADVSSKAAERPAWPALAQAPAFIS